MWGNNWGKLTLRPQQPAQTQQHDHVEIHYPDAGVFIKVEQRRKSHLDLIQTLVRALMRPRPLLRVLGAGPPVARTSHTHASIKHELYQMNESNNFRDFYYGKTLICLTQMSFLISWSINMAKSNIVNSLCYDKNTVVG